ncbi:Hypothetical_protein [Hexamita inflata]|uniref:Hypothetical_protein n=1 Tax=Hexamita inflata TaxID=28002 RepID=A0AA86QEI4_9EUKA|nr:Hypothetical protein HINF_LOCUS44248 [Hexamita inflata]
MKIILEQYHYKNTTTVDQKYAGHDKTLYSAHVSSLSLIQSKLAIQMVRRSRLEPDDWLYQIVQYLKFDGILRSFNFTQCWNITKKYNNFTNILDTRYLQQQTRIQVILDFQQSSRISWSVYMSITVK